MSEEGPGNVVRIYRQPGQTNMDIRVIGGEHFSDKGDKTRFEQKVEEIATRL